MRGLGIAAIGFLLSVSAYADLPGVSPVTFNYDTLITLPYNSQISYVEAFQKVLVEMDSKPGESHAALDWIIDQILCSADAANPPNPFCINLGVVQEAKDCPQNFHNASEFHNFDTGKYFKSIHLTSADPVCPGGGIPCSPFFGVASDGNLFCAKTNRTDSCEKKSEDKNAIKLIDIVKGCALKQNTKAKISCQQLPDFINTQANIVNTYCEKSTLACGILRDQVRKDFESFIHLDASTDKDQVEKINSYLEDMNKAKPVAGAAGECTPKTAHSRPSPVAPKVSGVTPPPPVEQANGCAEKQLDTNDQSMHEIWSTAFAKEKTGCSQFKIPGSGNLLTLHKEGMGIVTGLVETEPGADGKSKPIASLNFDSVQLMFSLSNAFKNPPYSVAASKLLDRYLPVTKIETSTGIKDPHSSKIYPAVEYKTQDGTTIRYTKDDERGELVVITLKGEKPSDVISWPLHNN